MIWQEQLQQFVNSVERLERYIHLTTEEKNVLENNRTMWGTTPHFAALMDPDDPNCPIRKQVIPSRLEQQNQYGMDNYLVWKENRATD